MKAKDLIKILQNNPEANILIHTTPCDEFGLCSGRTTHFFQAGDVIDKEVFGDDFTESTDCYGKLLVPVIILS